MKLSKFLAIHVVNKEDFCAGDVLDTKEYEAMLEVMSDDIAKGIVKYQEYLGLLNTSRYSVAVWALQQIEALSTMELKIKEVPEIICPLGLYNHVSLDIIDPKRCDYSAKHECTQACFLKLESNTKKEKVVCNHKWVERLDGFEEQCGAAICILCGRYGCYCDAKWSTMTKKEKKAFAKNGINGNDHVIEHKQTKR